MDMLKNNVNARVGMRDNVEYVKRHCSDCAENNCVIAQAYEKEGVPTPSHGAVQPMFQENKFLRFLLKNNLISPLWINKGYSKLISPFLGTWAMKRLVSNLITNAGMAGVASRINGSGAEAAFTHIGVGTGTTAAAVTDTTLETEIADSGLSRVAGTVSRVTTDVTDDTARVTTTFTVTGTKAVTEAGLLNAGAAGVLLARQIFSAVNVVNGDSLSINWSIDVD